MNNPFDYLQFAKGDQFYERREMLSDLKSRFLSGQTNVVIYGPRRYGKRSLVAELAEQLETEGFVCISFDMVKMPTVNLFAEAYATKVYRMLQPVRSEVRQIADFFKRLRPKNTMGADGEAGFSFDAASNAFS